MLSLAGKIRSLRAICRVREEQKKKNLAIAHSWKSLYKAAFHLLRKRYQVQDVESGGPGSGLGLLYYLWDMSM